ncbi:DUF3429 family protein [Thalassotalea aquiviva]|uniref:DUF3429 family protein n=1 Tax=Thalassotalea aquiviva TaxID=3242415 RepID=UPI00352B63DF
MQEEPQINYDQIFHTARVIGTIGVVFFLLLAGVMLLTKLNLLALSDQYLLMLFTFSSAILLAFLSGIIWSESLSARLFNPTSKHLYFSLSFNVIALFGAVLHNRWSVMLFGFSFLVLFFLEEELRRPKSFSDQDTPSKNIRRYLRMRKRLTYQIVVIHLFVLLLFIIMP